MKKIVFLVLVLLFGSSITLAREDDANIWRAPNPEDTLYLELQSGTVVIELNPQFAPGHVTQIKRLAREGFYNGLSFYRVIDGFVAQGGSATDEDDGSRPNHQVADKSLLLPMESSLKVTVKQPFTPVQSPDMFAPQTGFIDGFGAARNDSELWLIHCPGAVGMSRNNHPDSATTDFYIVIGQAPRYLDNIMTIIGRVIYGMDIVQSIKRGNAAGMFDNTKNQTRILKASIAADVSEQHRLKVEVERTDNQAFKDKLLARLNREHPFFYKKPPRVLDVCQVPVRYRLVK